jgi:effector-binding domain-containing protein
VVQQGTANWDTAFETLVDAFKTVKGYLERQGLAPSGPATVVYLSTDEKGFQFEAGYPIATPPKAAPRGDLTVSKLPDGKALKFTHRGSYDAMDTTYDAITNHIDEKRLDTRDIFIEEYVTDPTTTPEDDLVITVLVPIK